LCPPGHPYRSSSLNGLANAVQIRFQQTDQLQDLDEAIARHRDAIATPSLCIRLASQLLFVPQQSCYSPWNPETQSLTLDLVLVTWISSTNIKMTCVPFTPPVSVLPRQAEAELFHWSGSEVKKPFTNFGMYCGDKEAA
jgi:hypothetical protein